MTTTRWTALRKIQTKRDTTLVPVCPCKPSLSSGNSVRDDAFPLLTLLLALSLISVLPSKSAAGNKPDNDPKLKAEILAGIRRQPRLYYPTAALNDGLEGHGVCLIHFDTVTGKAQEVTITQSSGEDILDQAAVRVFRAWRIKRGTYDKIYVRFNFEQKHSWTDR